MNQSCLETALTGKQDTWICFLSIWSELHTLIFPGTLAHSFPVLFWLSSSANKGCCWPSTSHKQLFQHFSLFSHEQGQFCDEADAYEMLLNNIFFPKLQYWAALAYWHLRRFLVFQQFSLKVVIPNAIICFCDIMTIVLPLMICLSLVLKLLILGMSSSCIPDIF